MRVTIAAGVAAFLAAAPAPAAAPEREARSAAAPLVHHMLVLGDGTASVETVRARRTRVGVDGGRRCTVGSATPLAALVRADTPRLQIEDFGRCSDRPRDAGGLYVKGIGNWRERGRFGWVYKVGHKQGSAGGGDPGGPFGRGRLRNGARVTWFYCRLDDEGSCQRTLGTRSTAEAGGAVTVTVRAYDDEGRARPAAGATVHAGDASAVADDQGVARLSLPPGGYVVHAEQDGLIRSFPETLQVP